MQQDRGHKSAEDKHQQIPDCPAGKKQNAQSGDDKQSFHEQTVPACNGARFRFDRPAKAAAGRWHDSSMGDPPDHVIPCYPLGQSTSATGSEKLWSIPMVWPA